MIRVRTGSRLHFGLTRLPPAGPWPEGEPYFGGLGLMIEEPAVEAVCGAGEPPRLTLRPRPHSGLGTGTQSALACEAAVAGRLPTESDLAQWVERTGRGRRSAIGSYGFLLGGFLADPGRVHGTRLADPPVRYEFPAEWRIIVVQPAAEANWYGDRERAAFASLSGAADGDLREFAFNTVLPNLAADHLVEFGKALTEFNARAGEMFATIQGGRYSSPQTAAAVSALLNAGAAGAGQSSWGPTVWALAADSDHARFLLNRIANEWPTASVTSARNRGAEIHVKQ